MFDTETARGSIAAEVVTECKKKSVRVGKYDHIWSTGVDSTGLFGHGDAAFIMQSLHAYPGIELSTEKCNAYTQTFQSLRNN